METTLIQSEIEITTGQRVSSHSFGDGTVAEINGDVITVSFEDGEERKLKAEYLQPAETLEQLRDKFRACWMRGNEWRLEVGELLYKIKLGCAHGEWGDFLAEYDLARSTADDYVRRYEDAAEIAAPRQFNEPEPDPQAEERHEQIAEEKKMREGKKPSYHATELHVRIKDLKPHQMDLYREERKENPERVKEIWHQAFLDVIGVQEVAKPEQAEQDEQGAGEVPAETEGGASCSA